MYASTKVRENCQVFLVKRYGWQRFVKTTNTGDTSQRLKRVIYTSSFPFIVETYLPFCRDIKDSIYWLSHRKLQHWWVILTLKYLSLDTKGLWCFSFVFPSMGSSFVYLTPFTLLWSSIWVCYSTVLPGIPSATGFLEKRRVGTDEYRRPSPKSTKYIGIFDVLFSIKRRRIHYKSLFFRVVKVIFRVFRYATGVLPILNDFDISRRVSTLLCVSLSTSRI